MDLSKFLGLNLPKVSDSGKKISNKEEKKWRKRVMVRYLVACVFAPLIIIASYLVILIYKEFWEISFILFLGACILVLATREMVLRERRIILESDELRELLYG